MFVALLHVSRQATLEDITRATAVVARDGSVNFDCLAQDLVDRFYADTAMFTVRYVQDRQDWGSRKAPGGYAPMLMASSNLGTLSGVFLNKPVLVENESTVVKVYLGEGASKGRSAMAEPATIYSISASPSLNGKTSFDFRVTLCQKHAAHLDSKWAILKPSDAAHNERAFNMVLAFASHMWRRCN